MVLPLPASCSTKMTSAPATPLLLASPRAEEGTLPQVLIGAGLMVLQEGRGVASVVQRDEVSLGVLPPGLPVDLEHPLVL